MATQDEGVEYTTVVAGYLVKRILGRLRVAEVIDAVVGSQPVADVTYGALWPK